MYRMVFENAGNTCYLNAAMHLILHAPQLTNFFLKNLHAGKTSSAFVLAYGDLVDAYWSGGAIPVAGPYERATAIFLKNHADIFVPNAQHDALEAAALVLEDLHEGLGTFAGKSKAFEALRGADAVAWKAQKPSLITEIFGIQTIANDVAHDHATSVHVPATCGSIRDGILRLEEPESVEGGTVRKTRFTHLPLVLFAHIQRFESPDKKSTEFVECPRRMNLWGSSFALFAVVFHRGSLHSGGHYTCGVIIDDALKIFDDDAPVAFQKEIDGRAACAVAYKKLNP